MAISSTTTVFNDRKKDIHIFQGVNAPNTTVITPSFGNISNYCAGIQKLVQRYAITLLTELGSQPDFSTFGSSLITRLNNTAVTLGAADVMGLFNLANAKVIRSFRAYQSANPNTYQDEELNTSYLVGVSRVNDKVSLRIKIVSMAGDIVQFVLPLPEENE